jgi:Uma2 family endonuclease
MVATAKVTAAEFLAGEESNVVHNLIDGEVVVNEPTWWHQRAAGLIYARLLVWTEAAAGRGTATLPLDVLIDDDNVFAADVMWFRAGREPAWSGAQQVPDIAVEVRSPSTWRYDVGRKKHHYEQHGLPELWLVDHDAVLVFRRSAPRVAHFDVALELAAPERLTSPLLPGFALDLGELLGS